MRKAFLILAAALIAAAPVAATVTATPTEAAQKEIKKQGGNKGGGKKANANRKVSPKAQAGKNRNNNKVRSTQVRGGNSRNNNRYANNHRNNNHYYNNRHNRNHRYYYRHGYGWGWWAPTAIAAGVVTGAVIASQPVYASPNVYYEGAANRVESNAGRVPPAGGYAAFSPGWYEYCSSKYRSFDPNTGTYTGYDGNTHYCQ